MARQRRSASRIEEGLERSNHGHSRMGGFRRFLGQLGRGRKRSLIAAIGLVCLCATMIAAAQWFFVSRSNLEDSASVLRDLKNEEAVEAMGMVEGEPAVAERASLNPGPGIRVLDFDLDELQGMENSVRAPFMDMLHSGSAMLNILPTRLHGTVGLGPDARSMFVPVEMPSGDIDMALELRRGGGFNLALSDALPLDRDVLDNRHDECKSIHYDYSKMGKATIIIVFYNEPKSTLLRSIHSVYNYTPPPLLEGIILVDDGSSMDWIKAKEKGGTGELEYLVGNYPKMQLLRNDVRCGIVCARMKGIVAVKSPNFVVLDSHIETQPGWLEPLTHYLETNRNSVLMPQVDGMESEDFSYSRGGIGCVLGFLWKMIEHGYDRTYADNSPIKQRASPAMAGGLFAANTDFFLNDIGGYDEGFAFWGTENLEISFRIWMCGGKLECAPCSRVFHVFRKGGQGYSSPVNAVTKNKLRLMTGWMDEYADLAYRVIGEPRVDFGNVDKILAMRKEKQCHSFQWFIDNVYPEAYVRNLKTDVPYLGTIESAIDDMCVSSTDYNSPSSGSIKMKPCHKSHEWMYFSRPKYIMPVMNDEACLQAGSKTTMWCEHGELSRIDVLPHVQDSLRLERNGQCLTLKRPLGIHWASCDPEDLAQGWKWSTYTPPDVWTPPPPPAL